MKCRKKDKHCFWCDDTEVCELLDLLESHGCLDGFLDLNRPPHDVTKYYEDAEPKKE